jgi:hypothetical protein
MAIAPSSRVSTRSAAVDNACDDPCGVVDVMSLTAICDVWEGPGAIDQRHRVI